MSDRLFAVLWLLAMAGMAWIGWRIEAPFNYEPIGPRAYPLLLCALMVACAAWLLAKPDAESDWPRERRLQAKVGMLLGVLFGWALLFEPFGFMISTALAAVAIARLFEGRWLRSVAAAAVLSVGLYVFFDKGLDVVLPLGRLWGF